MKKRVLIALLLQVLICLTAFAGDSCIEAERLTKQAMSQANITDRLEAYTQARSLCPSDPSTHYRAGLVLMASGKHSDAEKALMDALARVVILEQSETNPDKRQEIRGMWLNVLGRLAENDYRSGNRPKALASFNAARKYARSDKDKTKDMKLPDWFIAVLKDFDKERDDNPLGPAEMHASVRGMRDLGVEPTVDYRVLFDLNSDQPTAEGKQQLHKIAESFKSEVGAIRIIGHTDKRGNNNYNQQLSERRAQSVAALMATDIPSLKGRIATQGKGGSELKYPGDSEEDHKMNRRVEFVLGN